MDRKLQMVDLQGQHRKIQTELNAAIQEVMNTTAFIKGPQVGIFEKNLASYLNVNHVIGVANGTDALQIALMALDLPADAEIITPDFTFVATAEVVRLLGYTPVLVDINTDTFNIDPDSLEKAITPKTKVIIPVHLFGQAADMDRIMEIAEKHNLYVVEDTAQAIGASYESAGKGSQKVGTIGHIGTTSFFPSKNLGCAGDGGAIITNDDELAKRIRSIANHGQGKQYFYNDIGVNSRLDTLQAAILDVKLRSLDEFNKARQEAAKNYDELLGSNPLITIPYREPKSTHIFHQYSIKIKNGKRNELMKKLDEAGIPNKIYYPLPIHAHKPYETTAVFDLNALSNTLKVSDEILSLPMHTELSREDIEYIANTVNQFLQ